MTNQLTLGQLIEALTKCDPNSDVIFDFIGAFVPFVSFNQVFTSCRSFPSSLALNYSFDSDDIPISCECFLEVSSSCLTTEFIGWNRVKHSVNIDTSIWIAQRGQRSNCALVGVLNQEDIVVLQTAYIP